MAVRALVDLNGLKQPLLGPPAPTHVPHLSSALSLQTMPELHWRSDDLQVSHSHAPASPWTLWTPILSCRLTSQFDLGPLSSPGSFLVIWTLG